MESCWWTGPCTPADIRYPTDLGLLNEAREKTEAIIDRIPIEGKFGAGQTAIWAGENHGEIVRGIHDGDRPQFAGHEFERDFLRAGLERFLFVFASLDWEARFIPGRVWRLARSIFLPPLPPRAGATGRIARLGTYISKPLR